MDFSPNTQPLAHSVQSTTGRRPLRPPYPVSAAAFCMIFYDPSLSPHSHPQYAWRERERREVRRERERRGGEMGVGGRPQTHYTETEKLLHEMRAWPEQQRWKNDISITQCCRRHRHRQKRVGGRGSQHIIIHTKFRGENFIQGSTQKGGEIPFV